MATLETLAHEKQELEVRRDQALGALAARAGDSAPRIRDVSLAKVPSEQREHMLGMMTLTTIALEQIRALAAEVDQLRAEVDALKGARKGAKS
jgi:hypothetical protein